MLDHRPDSTPVPAHIGQLLGLADAGHLSDVDLARRVGDGLMPDALDRVIAAVPGLGRADDIVPEATLRRARGRAQPLSRDHSERIYKVAQVVDAVLRAYHGDADMARAFLSRRHPLLQGERPYDLTLVSSAGADAVLALIGRAQAGVAV